MSDNQQVDDLLEAVEGLDIAEEDLAQNFNKNRQKLEDLQALSDEAKMDSSLLALEAAKAAQDAATQSQEAAHASLKLSEKMREHTDELTNANFNWRQSIRNASVQLSDSKKIFISMMIITLLLTLVAIGFMSSVYYQLNHKQEQFKGEILEVIQTENAIFKRDLTIKMDDLAAQIEASRFYVEKLANNTQSKPTASNTDEMTSADEASTANKVAQTQPDGAIQAQDESAMAVVASKPTATPQIANINSTQLEEIVHNQLQALLTPINKQLTELGKQQTQITQSLNLLSENSKLSGTTPTSGHNIAQLNAKQSKQLTDIRWLISKHDKHLKAISSQLDKLPTAPQQTAKNSQSQQRLEAQFNQMQMQQKLIEEQLSKLQENIKLIMKKVDQDKPYSYKAK